MNNNTFNQLSYFHNAVTILFISLLFNRKIQIIDSDNESLQQ